MWCLDKVGMDKPPPRRDCGKTPRQDVRVSGWDKFAGRLFWILQGLSALGARWGCPKETFYFAMVYCFAVCVVMGFIDLAAVVFHWRKGQVQA